MSSSLVSAPMNKRPPSAQMPCKDSRRASKTKGRPASRSGWRVNTSVPPPTRKAAPVAADGSAAGSWRRRCGMARKYSGRMPSPTKRSTRLAEDSGGNAKSAQSLAKARRIPA